MKRTTGDAKFDDRLSCAVDFSPDEECTIGKYGLARLRTRHSRLG